MFEAPDAKRVRRSELLSAPPSPSNPPSADNQHDQSRTQLRFDLDFVDVSNAIPSQAPTIPHAAPPHQAQPGAPVPALDPSNEAFEFRLFGAPRRDEPTPVPPTDKQPGVHRISIRSPTPLSSAGDGGFVVPFRPQSYYFAHGADMEQKKATYTETAVSGQQVLERARKTRWPGTALPWRVIHLNATKSSSSSSSIKSHAALSVATARAKTRRTRAGKKRRLAIRKKFAVMAAKVETEQEKRTRRNREKKVKKKEREKLKKIRGLNDGVAKDQHG